MTLPELPPWTVDLDEVRDRRQQLAKLLALPEVQRLFQTLWPHGLPEVFGAHLSSDVGWMIHEIEQLRVKVAGSVDRQLHQAAVAGLQEDCAARERAVVEAAGQIEQMHNALACVVSLARRAILLDPREILSAAGVGPACVCPAVDDWDPDCPLCQTGAVTSEEMAKLIKLARPALHWAMGAWADVIADDPENAGEDRMLMGVLANVISALVTGLRPGFGPAALRQREGA